MEETKKELTSNLMKRFIELQKEFGCDVKHVCDLLEVECGAYINNIKRKFTIVK